MALKIKKQIKNTDGTITEVEGTEAEVEAFLKKQNKRNEDVEQKKRNLILGKEALAEVQKMIDAAIIRHNLLQNHNGNAVIHQHWYHNNGYWWQPRWTGNRYDYVYTMQNPTFGTGLTDAVYCSSNELSSKIGVNSTEIANALSSVSTITSDKSKWLITQGNTPGPVGNYAAGNFTLDASKQDNTLVVGGPSISANCILGSDKIGAWSSMVLPTSGHISAGGSS